MGEQLKEQTLFDALEANSKNIFWVDRYVSGPEGSGGTYESRRMTQQQLIDLMQGNLDFNTGVKIFKNITGFTIPKGSLVGIDAISSGVVTAVPMSSSSDGSGSKLYVAIEDILNNGSGSFIEEGVITGFDTSSFAIGDWLYWNPTTETIDDTAEADKMFLGVVVTSNVSGAIYVSPTRNYSLVTGSAGQVALFVGTNHIQSNSRFTFIDNVGVEVGFRFDDGAGNLTQIGCTYANIESEGIASNSALRLANWSNGSEKGIVSFRKSRGTKSAPTQVIANDVLGAIIGAGQHNSGSGTTTFEAKIVAKEDYAVDEFSDYPTIYRYALTEFQLLLASSNDSTVFSPPFINNKVFSVDGNGKVSFKNFSFPILDGTANQVLKTDGAGQLSWGTPSSGISGMGSANQIAFFDNYTSVTSNSKLRLNPDPDSMAIIIDNSASSGTKSESSFGGSVGFYHVSNSFAHAYLESASDTYFPIFKLGRYRGALGATTPYQDGDTLGVIRFGNADIITGIARESATTGWGVDAVFKAGVIGSSAHYEVIRLLASNGKLRVGNAYDLPKVDGTSGQVLVTDGAGNVYWGAGSGSSDFIPKPNALEIFRGQTYRYNSTTPDLYAGLTTSNSASISAQVTGTTNYYQRFIRARYYASIVQTGRYTGVRGTQEIFYITSGFRFQCIFRVADTVYSAGTQQFYGLGEGTTDLVYGGSSLIQLSTLFNLIGVGNEASDTNLQIFHNDASGVCTKVDLGANFPANRTAGSEMTTMYSVEIFNAIGSSNVLYQVKNLENGSVAQGTLTTNLPSITQGLNIFASRTMNSPTTNTGQFDLSKWGCSSL